MKLALLLLLASSSVALAQQVEEAPPAGTWPIDTAPRFELSLKAGGHFPQIVNSLGTTFDGVVKFGVAPFSGRQLQIFADLGYSRPSHTVTQTDPRLGAEGESYTSVLTVNDLRLTAGLQYFFVPTSGNLLPYAGAGIRMHMLRIEVDGASEQAFGDNRETSTRPGGVGFGGVALKLGPGIVLGELSFGYAPVDERVTGTSNIGALSVLLGYGLMF